ncbi:hypothetical protein DSO57_1012590 [Entomophthora muscae]|uniref:Uncharacterized protein n=1 Tax=Entomophthora muscae TaxID=34485 RepID=A0ACC2URT3_9FUNG|nr:hypothetical protein DSO57_1012590 [Entomophthora muscae]
MGLPLVVLEEVGRYIQEEHLLELRLVNQKWRYALEPLAFQRVCFTRLPTRQERRLVRKYAKYVRDLSFEGTSEATAYRKQVDRILGMFWNAHTLRISIYGYSQANSLFKALHLLPKLKCLKLVWRLDGQMDHYNSKYTSFEGFQLLANKLLSLKSAAIFNSRSRTFKTLHICLLKPKATTPHYLTLEIDLHPLSKSLPCRFIYLTEATDPFYTRNTCMLLDEGDISDTIAGPKQDITFTLHISKVTSDFRVIVNSLSTRSLLKTVECLVFKGSESFLQSYSYRARSLTLINQIASIVNLDWITKNFKELQQLHLICRTESFVLTSHFPALEYLTLCPNAISILKTFIQNSPNLKYVCLPKNCPTCTFLNESFPSITFMTNQSSADLHSDPLYC